MRLFRPPHTCLRYAHSSSSLPLQSVPYASASTRSLRAPQHALNPFSSTPIRSYCTLHPAHSRAITFSSTPVCSHRGRQPALFLARSPQRILAPPPAHAGLLHGELLRTIASSLVPLGEPGEKSLRPTLLPADSCRTAGIEDMGLHRNRQSVVACNRRPRVETAASLTTLVNPKGQTSLPTLGPTGDHAA